MALHIYKQQNDKATQASCLNNLASCYRNTGNFNAAIDLTKQALDLNKRLKGKTTEETKKQTEKKYTEKLKQCQRLSEVKMTLFAEGKKTLKEKQYEKALEKLKETKKIYKQEKMLNTKPLANCFFKLAACAKGLGDDEKAKNYAQKASEIIKALSDLSEEKRDKEESNVKQFFQTP